MTNKKKNILITGGAGFIGSNLAKAMLNDPRIGKVRVLDNLSTGKKQNIKSFLELPNFEFIDGDIRNFDTCLRACKNMDMVTHQAALGSVPRSINDPLMTNNNNITGTLNMFKAAVDEKIERVVFAASSSTYGDSKAMPKLEDNIGKPLSPYAVTKLVNELYADTFSKVYDFKYVGLRYFNVFGPNQCPNGAYAAVIPLFLKAALEKRQSIINGDGSFSRDFTYVDNVVQANLNALFTDNENALNQIYNIACGERTSLKELHAYISNISNSYLEPIHGPQRKGDIPHSLASIDKAKQLLNYIPEVTVEKGIEKTWNWFKQVNATVHNRSKKQSKQKLLLHLKTTKSARNR